MYTYDNILIDGDAIAFAAACTGQHTQFNIVDSAGNEVIVYATKKDATAYVAKSKKDDLSIVKAVTPSPLWLVKKIIDNQIETIRKNLNCNEFSVFVGGPSGTKTYRHKLAVTAPYKGNRPDERPEHLGAAIQHLVTEYNAIRAADNEADDLLGIEQCKPDSNCIMAGIDKDLMMIPGWHYNISTKEIVWASDPGELTLKTTKSGKKIVGTGLMWLFAQCLLGDVCDNIIKPQKGLGDVKVYELLTNPELCTILDIYNLVKDIYKKNDRDIEENLSLLWIQREVGKTWRDVL